MRAIQIFILLVSAVLVLGTTGVAGSGVCDYKGCSWLASGVVSGDNNSGFVLLGKDGKYYTVRSTDAQVVRDTPTATGSRIQSGEVVRVFGTIVDRDTIRAIRIRVLQESPKATCAAAKGAGPIPEIKIVVEKTQTIPETQSAVAPKAEQPCLDWDNNGLITEIDPVGRKIKVRTSCGQYTINIQDARLLNGRTPIGLGRLSLGDTIRITGWSKGPYEIDAQQVVLGRARWEAENALPQLPASVAGVIQQIDYPSGTFTMTTQSSIIVVMVDKNTCVQSEKKSVPFTDLKPGTRVKMTGHGSPATGYAAQHIQIISISY